MPNAHNTTDAKFLYCSLPALPVILGGIVIIWQGDQAAFLSNVLVSLFLVFCGIGSGLFLWYRHVNELTRINSRWQQDETGKIDAVVAYTSELERLLLTISPILSQHVMVSREHTEQEIVLLTSRFAEMVNDLQQIVNSADSTLGRQDYHLDSVISTSRDLLQPVLDVLKQIHKREHHVLAELQKLSGRMTGLSPIAAELGNLTGQMNQLALSAMDEAASGSEQSQSFAFIADRAHQLSDDFLQLDKQLNREVDDLIAAVTAALTISEKAVQVDDSILLRAETNIDQTLSHLSQVLAHYRDDASALRNNAEQIQDEINKVLVALQFQDRVSQILTQVENNLLNLQETIEKIQQQGSKRDGNMLRVDEAVEHIEENYKSVSSRPDQAPDSSDELTFF